MALAIAQLLTPALLVQPPRLPQPRLPAERLSTAATAAAAAFGTCGAAHADLPAWSDVMTELNKPPITLNPFSVSPAGQSFFLGYACYLGWQIFRPPNEAEIAAQQKREAAGAEAAAAAAPFMNAAAEAEGAITTASGLVYEELAAGAGATPTPEQKVKVHYTGTLADGTVFDSSRERGSPTEFKLNQVIRGWQEGAPPPTVPGTALLLGATCQRGALPAGLALMKTGGRAKLTIPASLAYGDQAVGQIPPNSALCFDVELLEIQEDSSGFKLPF